MEQAVTKIIDLLFLAKQSGIDIILNGERLQLKVAENKDIDKSLLEEIKSNKQSIIDFLNNENWKSKSVGENHKKIDAFDRKTISHIPLSFSQERLWFVDQLEGSVEYNLPAVMRLKGNLNRDALVHAMKTVVSRHEALRTVFKEEAGQPYQSIQEITGWQLYVVQGEKCIQATEGLQQYIKELSNEPFDLSKDYMIRASLIILSVREHVLVVTMHHIASDAWSMPIIVREVMEIYNAYVEERPVNLAQLPIQYSDYALWQRNYLQGEILNTKIEYWKNKLADVVPLQLPTDFVRPPVKGTRGASVVFSVEKDLSENIQQLSQQQGATLYITLLAAFKVLLYRYSGQKDICVGTSIANRSQRELEDIIGYFVNTLALRSEVNCEASFSDLLQQVRTTMIEAYEHQELPFEKVVEVVVKERDASRSPLFQVMLVLQNTPEAQELHLGEVQLSVEKFTHENAKFDISFFVNETTSGLKGWVEYSTDLYNESTINRMIDHYKELLSSIVKDPQQNIGKLSMLTHTEEQQLLVEFNDTSVDYPKDKTIVDLFEEQAAKTPGAIAVEFEEEQLSFQQLDERANQLAHYLRSRGVKQETLVPICIERSLEMIVGILGILKAGGAYVPIEPDFPEERKSFVLEDTAARLVVSSTRSSSALPALAGVEVVETDGDWSTVNGKLSTVNRQLSTLNPHHLAYVIYTSGSTGKPKGVMIEHRHLVDYVYGLNQKVQVDQCRSYALVSSMATDLGNTVIYPSLVFGGVLHIFSKESVSNIEYLHKYFKEHSIECLKIVPSHWKALSMGEDLLLPSRLMVFGGEALQSELVENIRSSGAALRVVNHYGPTETTIGKLLHEVKPGTRYNKTIPIGKPFSNTQVYILSETLQLCPVGVAGELHIAGEGVARGYLNNEELTRTKFINNPFDKESVMYRTGDLVRWLKDGDIEFIGRVDDQVKIRGYRVELGEIESIMLQSGLVSQAVVLAKEDKDANKRLVGYVAGNEDFDKESLVSYLKEKLPEYMVPGLWVELEKFPLLPNGKIDRKSLPDPEVSEQLSGKYVAPRNEAEERLAVIWQDVLEVEQAGVYDDFFELGGHSLLAVRLISAIRKEFTVEMPISDVFDHPTIASLAMQLQTDSGGAVLPSIQAVASRPDRIPLSFSQERLWFIDQLEGSVQYHVPAALRLKGRLNREALAHSLETIVDRHEVLRTVFLQEDGKAWQKVKAAGGWQLRYVEGAHYKQDGKALQHYLQQIVNEPFDLTRDYMLRGHLITLTDEEHILIVTLHHIASDGWSRSILVKEVVELYSSYIENRKPLLAALPVQYADYALWQRHYLQGNILDEKLNYWKNKLQNVEVLRMPTDYARPLVLSTRGAGKGFSIDRKLTAELQLLSKQQGSTLFMTLLAAFKVLLHRYSGQQDICVGSPVAGRQQQELEPLIGFFVNTLALRSNITGDESFNAFLQQLKATTLEAYEHQEVSFEKVVDEVVKERDLSRSPLTQVQFVLRNTPEVPELQLGELSLSAEAHERTTTQFDITFFITETANGLQMVVEYSTDLYNEQTIDRMILHFNELLASIVSTPERKVGELEILTQEEKNQLVHEFNDTKVDYPKDKTIVDLFEEQTESTPNNLAVVFEEEEVSYKELNERSNQLAHYLKNRGVKEETLVPICIERSLEMIVGILGILKAGGAYVPIDPEYPEERISYMLEDTKAEIVVSSKASRSKLKTAEGVEIIEMDGDWSTLNGQLPTNNDQRVPQLYHLAYVIYTSGSTGKPKGVMIEHHSLVNYLLNSKTKYISDEKGGSGSFIHLSYTFDASLTGMFMPLLCGKSVVIGSKQSVDVFEDSNLLKYAPYDFIKITPSHLQLLQPGINGAGSRWLTNKLVIGGEALHLSQFEYFVDNRVDVEIINEYGPTEATVGCSTFSFETLANNEGLKNEISIGKPIDNVQIYILNERNKLLPVGVIGEICIGGAGVARGYLNRPSLTEEKFINDPFNKETGARLYRTGDLARWMPDGNIEYLGRKDDQVKIRGYRIELGEVESAVNDLELVSISCVVAKQDAGDTNKLISYYVPEDEVVKAKERELYLNRVASWKELYESEYGQTEEDENIDPEFNIIGWNDSFTGGAIPPQQMKEWLDDIIHVILSQQPENVLEIGCGTGLIYYQLAGKVKKYIGADLSRSSIKQITNRIEKGTRDYGITELMTAPAHEVTLKENEQVDTIILNSMVQYFPGEEYMNNVIEKSISLLKGEGRVIIGDVRDNRLLEVFKGRLQAQKLQDSVSIKEYKWLVEQDVLKEEELCFSPDYFYRLQSLYPRITHVDIQLKQGSSINELTLYRYNVVLYVGINTEVFKPVWQNGKQVASKQSIIDQFQKSSPTVGLQDVPHFRLWKERLLNQALNDKSLSNVGDLKQSIEKEDKETEEINQILSVAKEKGYSYKLFLNKDALKMNLLFELNTSNVFVEQPYYEKEHDSNTSPTNIPLFSDISLLLQKEIRFQLQQRLPEYMIPLEMIALNQLPLTNNGKVDRLFLSQREERNVVNKLNYQSPRTEVEEKLAFIWQDLLHVERVGINDNFFELGGHSLLAMRVIAAIRKEMQVELVIKDLFASPTIASLALHIQQQGKGLLLPPIQVLSRTNFIPLSFSQERLWFIDQMEGSVQYHIPAVFGLKGKLNTNALEHALQTIINRHEVLRTMIRMVEGNPYQSIKATDGWQLEIIGGSTYQQDSKVLNRYIQQLIKVPFDLSKDYMVRASLINVAADDHVLVATMHHIASDGWSMSIIVKEVAELYSAYVEDRPAQLAPLSIQYADYAIWQRNYLQGEVLDRKIDYWKQKLSGVAPLQLPTDRQRPGVWSTRGAFKGFSLDKLLSSQLQALSQQQGTTLYMTLLAAFKVLLYRYSGQQDICVGSPIANRTQQEVEGLIGFFVNTLALRSELNGDALFTDLLQQVRVTTMEAYEHQDVPFEKVVEVVVKERDLSRNPLFQVMFSLQNTPEVPQLDLGEVLLSNRKLPHSNTKFDITFLLVETPQGLRGDMQYATDLYDESTISRMLDHFKQLLGSIVKSPQQKIRDLAMLTKAEEHQLLVEFNDTKVDYPKDKTIVDLFEEQAAKTPGATAVIFEEEKLSYAALNEKANQLAHYLRGRGVKEETLVPICIERSLEMIVGILGILKAGGAYVPIDPEYPEERISYMLEDTDAAIVVSSKESRSKLKASEGVEIIEMDGDWSTINGQLSTINHQRISQPNHLAYVIYTSGSTGKPKGVMMRGGGLVNLLSWQEKQLENKSRRVLQFASLNFDVSFQEIFSTLCFGSELHLISADTRRDMPAMVEDLGKHHITHLFIPYIVLKNLAEYILSLSDVSFSLQEIIVAGEQLKLTEDIQAFIKENNISLINQYGPTEAHVVSSYNIDTNAMLSPLPPIGKPIDNTRLYVLSDRQKLLPVGVAGELYIGGVQVARGYLNRPELTKEKFIADSFSKEAAGAQMYKTGDLARWLNDGNIEYLGRIDDQVKIRGYRVELGEIETVLQQHESVRQGVVLAREDSNGNKRLVGYVASEGIFNKEEILTYLKGQLPEYMVPALWVELENLPVTANGKINRKALPDPDASELLSNNYVAPRNEVEVKLVAIWQELLGVEKVGVYDNFFELGGHSLLAIRVISAIRKQLNVELAIKDLFHFTTINDLSKYVEIQTTYSEEKASAEYELLNI